MPTRLHKPMHEPARLTDRVLAHPWELGAVSGAWTALGALLCWSWIDPGGGPSTVLSGMSAWIAGAVAVSLLLSGLMILIAVTWPGRDSAAWRIELFGLPLGISAWASYGLVAPSAFWKILALGYVIGATLRLIAAWLNMRQPTQVIVLPPTDTE